MASQVPAVKGVAFDLYCFIPKNDGTIIVNPGGLASRICKDGDTGAVGPTPTVVDSTGGTVKLSLTTDNMNADCITVKITSTDSGALPVPFTIYTSGQTIDTIDGEVGAIKAKTDIMTGQESWG
jgi:hypothetical protein